MNIIERFKQFDDEYLKFDRVVNPRTTRPDLNALYLLDEIFNGDRDIISVAEHDEIYLDIEGEQLDRLTDKQIEILVRCGVRYDSELDCLAMFV